MELSFGNILREHPVWRTSIGVCLAVVLSITWPANLLGDDQVGSSESRDSGAGVDPATMQAFAESMTGATLVGSFTMVPPVAQDKAPAVPELHSERYEIVSVKKLPRGDFWSITARIKYGNHDLQVPVPLEIQWAGKTPVLVVDQWRFPGMGTFDARVLIHQERYVGTWQHDDKGGHLFGVVVPPPDGQGTIDEPSAGDESP